MESDLRAAAEGLHVQMNERGYLFFRGIVPVEEVMAVRRDVLEQCRQAGWLDPSRDLIRPRRRRASSPRPRAARLLRGLPQGVASTALPPFSVSAHAYGASAVPARAEVPAYPRRIGRLSFPNNLVATTPPHQDHHYIRGAVETYSCRTPLGDCPTGLGAGGLAGFTRTPP